MKDIPLHHLIGDPEENFYRLGIKDQDCYRPLLEQAKHLTGFPKLIEKVAQEALPKILARKGNYQTWLQAYAAGLGESPASVSYALLVPELSLALCQLRLALPSSLGCSSYFLWDEKQNAPVHGRILDFPLLGPFDRQERAILYHFPGTPKIFSFGSAGFPWPCINAMTEDGITLALHQKFDNVFHPQGTPIFDLIFELLLSCDDLDSVLTFLKQAHSIVTWGLYMSFADGKVLAADLMGNKLHANCYQLEPGQGLYFCNHLEKPCRQRAGLVPFGMPSYNQMRERIGLQKIARVAHKDDFALIKEMATPLKLPKHNPCDDHCDPITMASIAVATFTPAADRALFLPGSAPKYYQGKILEFSDAFDSPKQRLHSRRGKTDANYTQGMRHLMSAQMAHYRKDGHAIYHHMQMALPLLAGHPEQQVGKFFFLVFQYIYEKHSRCRELLLEQFRSMEGSLPPILNDHCLLFIARLTRRLGQRSEPFSPEDIREKIQNPDLRKLFCAEQSRPILLPEFIHPCMDILDIVYLHAP